MATKRVENSMSRLREKIHDAKEYFKQETYEFNELMRLKKHLEKKKLQFDKDITEYESTPEKDEEKLLEYDNFKSESEDVMDDIEHYIEVEEKKSEEKEKKREAEEREKQREAEERKRLEQVEEKRRQEEREEKRVQNEMQFELEKMKIEADERRLKMEMEEKLAIEQLKLEKMKVESTERITKKDTETTMKQKMNVRLAKLEPKKFDGNILKFQEFWDTFESTVHKNDILHKVDKFNYLKTQLTGSASELISGMELTNDNYDEAIQLLMDRYGRKQISIDAHYAQMMNLPIATYKTSSLRSFYDTTEKHLRALKALGEDINQKQILSMIKSKLPRNVITRMEEFKDDKEEWSVESFRKRLQKIINAQEAGDIQYRFMAKPEDTYKRVTTNQQSPGYSTRFTGEALLSSELKKSKIKYSKCIFCEGSHWSDECQQYQDVDSRKTKIKNRCYICLKENHRAKDCSNKEKLCVHCGDKGKHHRSLCPKKFKKLQSDGERTDKEQKKAEVSEVAGVVTVGESVVMKTAKVTVSDKEKKADPTETRILLDSGSHRTYIAEELADKLKLHSDEKEIYTVYTFGNKKPKGITTSIVNVTLKSKFGKDITIKASIVPQITGLIQRRPIPSKERYYLQKNYQLADSLPVNTESSTLGILIGNDYYDDIVLDERKKLQSGLHIIKTKFGWILSGKMTVKKDGTPENTLFVMTQTSSRLPPEVHKMHSENTLSAFQPQIEDLWNLETIGINPKSKDERDDLVMESFKNTVSKQPDGRYQVSWPWRKDDPNLPDNYELSLGRLKTLIRRFHSDKDLLKKYNDIIMEQLKKGIIEKVTDTEDSSNMKHYIPHHAVINPESSTTKIRVVYDASAKTKKGTLSLNECLHRGPVILEDLCGLIMRFRAKKIGIIADIEKAFLQVSLQPQDRDVTRFLWLKDIDKEATNGNLEIYRFTRLPFGVISSPFLLGATILHHLEMDGTPTAKQIEDDIYVDNVITGADNEKDALLLYRNSKKIFQAASMNLRCWISNSPALNKNFDTEDKLKESIVKVLGLTWNTKSDELSISTKKFFNGNSEETKRGILAKLSSIFDPLGLLSPATLSMKLFVQDLWDKKKDWDEKLTTEEMKAWKNIITKLTKLNTITVPRFIGMDGNTQNQLLVFCDASKRAYAFAIYLRTTHNGEVNTNLIFAKARIAPKKKLTMPRLELMSTLIGTRSLKFVMKEMKLPTTTKKILWTDSKCVLYWIKNKDGKSTFVKNRIKEILQDDSINFRYINTKENPADLPTRGLSSDELINQKIWWHGPEWLSLDMDDWPHWNAPIVNDEDDIEDDQNNKKNVIFEMSGIAQEERTPIKTPFGIDENKFSSLTKLLRVTAYVNRFIKIIRKKVKVKGHLTAEEIIEAETLWIACIQKNHFITETGKINQQLKKSQLNPKKHEDGIIRVHGRYTNAELPEATKSPILLPRTAQFTKLMIKKIHHQILHFGVSHTLAEIRKKYWIPQGRTTIKFELKRCFLCKLFQGGPYKIKPMSPWPNCKVSRSAAFENTGLDYFGPLYVKNGKEHLKAWVCLFTCVATRGVHLELVADMTPEQFLMALRRFIARRGKPDVVISDNAKQFKVAHTAIDIVWDNILNEPEVHGYLSNKGIKWSFIKELSPWMGGFYERLVGITKNALKKSIGRLHLTSLQLQTTLTEIESIVNSRPLVYIDDDLDGHTIITPQHFLSINTKCGSPSVGSNEDLNDPDYTEEKLNSAQKLLETWKKGNKHLDQFWKVWKNQYLLSLRERSQIYNKHPRVQAGEEPSIGDVVQIKDTTPRGTWKIGRIVELVRSPDGLERAAKVKLPNKTILQRSIIHLYPLECNSKEEEKDVFVKKDIMERTDEKSVTQNDERKEKDDQPSPLSRSKRKAAKDARDRIYAQHLSDE